jgi:hypothetical protein
MIKPIYYIRLVRGNNRKGSYENIKTSRDTSPGSEHACSLRSGGLAAVPTPVLAGAALVLQPAISTSGIVPAETRPVVVVDTAFLLAGQSRAYSVEAFREDWHASTSTIINSCK